MSGKTSQRAACKRQANSKQTAGTCNQSINNGFSLPSINNGLLHPRHDPKYLTLNFKSPGKAITIRAVVLCPSTRHSRRPSVCSNGYRLSRLSSPGSPGYQNRYRLSPLDLLGVATNNDWPRGLPLCLLGLVADIESSRRGDGTSDTIRRCLA